jgi:N-acetylmuramoyl-L-alanine amidase
MVMGRANAGRQVQNRLLVVIEVDATPVTKAAKGTKVYRVLPVGSPATFLVEERDIKKTKTKKSA